MRKPPSKLLAFTAVPVWLALSISQMFFPIYTAEFLPSPIVNLAFFSPQYLFSFSQVVQSTGYAYNPLFTSSTAIMFGVALWLLVTVGYGLIAQRFPRLLTLPLALVAVVAVTLMVHYCFSMFGYSLQLDGP